MRVLRSLSESLASEMMSGLQAGNDEYRKIVSRMISSGWSVSPLALQRNVEVVATRLTSAQFAGSPTPANLEDALSFVSRYGPTDLLSEPYIDATVVRGTSRQGDPLALLGAVGSFAGYGQTMGNLAAGFAPQPASPQSSGEPNVMDIAIEIRDQVNPATQRIVSLAATPSPLLGSLSSGVSALQPAFVGSPFLWINGMGTSGAPPSVDVAPDPGFSKVLCYALSDVNIVIIEVSIRVLSSVNNFDILLGFPTYETALVPNAYAYGTILSQWLSIDSPTADAYDQAFYNPTGDRTFGVYADFDVSSRPLIQQDPLLAGG